MRNNAFRRFGPLLVLPLALLVQWKESKSLAVELPTVPIGEDAYRQWDRWAQQRIGVRAYMRSTYDRTGGNRRADASNFLYQTSKDFNVTLDVESPGILYFVRHRQWFGSPWHYEVDGVDHIVAESSTENPNKPVQGSVFLPEKAFPPGLTYTWATTRGANLNWVPIGFRKSFRMAYERTKLGTGYYIYHHFVPGIPLSQPIRTWTPSSEPSDDVVELLACAGTDLLPHPNSPEGNEQEISQQQGVVQLNAKETVVLAKIGKAPSVIRAIDLSAPREKALSLDDARLRITWDGRKHPSVDAPISLFFGTGTFYNRDDREYLVKALPVYIRFDDDRVKMACFFPMPFFEGAKIELIGGEEPVNDVEWSIRYAPCTQPREHLAYFHATYVDHKKPRIGHDLVLLDTTKVEGGGEWAGHFVGTSFIFSHEANLTTLEGDPRFFFDNSKTPQAQGTGTEEWAGGGGYWGGTNMTLPLVGHPVGAGRRRAKNQHDRIESAYRFLLADLMPFGRNARIQLEHGGINQSDEHYKTVTYWYGAPFATLVRTDSLNIADEESEQLHDYRSPDASEPYEITSRYELGPDQLPLSHRETYPAHTDYGRKTTGISEFSLQLHPENVGVMLRRKLDYMYPNQRAEIFVADDAEVVSDQTTKWKKAGVWYLAGSNTCVYSNPKGELDRTVHEVITSNRRFRDDEFLLPRSLTAERSRIRVRVKFTPIDRPLFPGHPLAPSAWTEIRYDTYCYVMPGATTPSPPSVEAKSEMKSNSKRIKVADLQRSK